MSDYELPLDKNGLPDMNDPITKAALEMSQQYAAAQNLAVQKLLITHNLPVEPFEPAELRKRLMSVGFMLLTEQWLKETKIYLVKIVDQATVPMPQIVTTPES